MITHVHVVGKIHVGEENVLINQREPQVKARTSHKLRCTGVDRQIPFALDLGLQAGAKHGLESACYDTPNSYQREKDCSYRNYNYLCTWKLHQIPSRL